MVTTCSAVMFVCVALRAMSCHVVSFLKLKAQAGSCPLRIAPELTVRYVGLQIECRRSSDVSPRIS